MPQSQLEHTVLDHLNTAVMLFGTDLCLKYLNPAAEMLFQFSARQMIGVHAATVLHCPDTHVDRRLSEALSSRHPFTERELTVALPDGRAITVNCTVLPLHHFDAEAELLVELHQVDQHLRITREEHLLSQHQAAQSLIKGLAHEIKNPLGGLRGAAQLLERELPDPALKEYTRIIIEEADRLQSLMNRMMGPNRMPSRVRLNIHAVLEHVRGLIMAENPSGPDVRCDYDPSIPELLADQDRLIQALLNIARNAVAAAGRGGTILFRTRVLRQFTIGSRRYRLVLLTEVRDDGPGIPERIKDQIFFPMVTGHPDGFGIGLPIAQDLIHQHGGLIECESRPGETRFYVYLPLEAEHD
jgi:two-component system, NtrC family, nitrogen regulation sensor histidine kinase GlnL